MFIVGLLSWWYSAGWKRRIMLTLEKIDATADFFSIDLLLKTLFSPFRQISAGKVSGPIGVRWRAFVDRLVSRVIGAVVRSGLIIAGLITILVQIILGFIVIIGWLIVPIAPIVGIILMISGWTPSWI